VAYDWLFRLERLRAGNLSLREQARLAQNPLDLRWQTLAPRTPVTSILISEIRDANNFRPAGMGRREWNAQPRELPEKHGPRRDYEMSPISYVKRYGERAQQLLGERGDDAVAADGLVRAGIVRDVDAQATYLSNAVYTDVEAEFFSTWYTNQMTVLDPAGSTVVTVSAQLNAGDFITEPTIWTDAGVNAWDRFIYHLKAARRRMKVPIAGVRTRADVIAQILADAPVNAAGYQMTRQEAEARLSQEGAGNIVFVEDERTYDKLTGGGNATVETNLVPDGHLAFQPADGRVGATYVAPVVRAYQALGENNVRAGRAQDVVIILSEENNGQTLRQEAQMNALSLPDLDRVYVVDTLM
jgi:hypothetical protein